jgi:hypothetical protein
MGKANLDSIGEILLENYEEKCVIPFGAKCYRAAQKQTLEIVYKNYTKLSQQAFLGWLKKEKKRLGEVTENGK